MKHSHYRVKVDKEVDWAHIDHHEMGYEDRNDFTEKCQRLTAPPEKCGYGGIVGEVVVEHRDIVVLRFADGEEMSFYKFMLRPSPPP